MSKRYLLSIFIRDLTLTLGSCLLSLAEVKVSSLTNGQKIRLACITESFSSVTSSEMNFCPADADEPWHGEAAPRAAAGD